MSQIKTSLKLVEKIEKIRSKNNKNWMNLLKLALKLDPKNTSKILKEICKEDNRVSNIARKLYLINNKK